MHVLDKMVMLASKHSIEICQVENILRDVRRSGSTVTDIKNETVDYRNN
jgi:hypothetical protein